MNTHKELIEEKVVNSQCDAGDVVTGWVIQSDEVRKILQDTIDTALEGAVAAAYENAIELSDKIELSADLPDGGVEQWKAFKRFRNTLRDTYLTPLPDKE